MCNWIRDHLPSVQTFLIFYAGYGVACILAHSMLLALIFAALPLFYLALAITADRASPKRVVRSFGDVPDIDLTW